MQPPLSDANLNRRIYIGTSIVALIFMALMVFATGWKFLVGLIFYASVLLLICFLPWTRRDDGRQKHTQANFLVSAKHGALIDRIGWICFWAILWIDVVWSYGFPSVLLPREYDMASYWAGTIGLSLMAWAIFMWLKRRQTVLISNPECPD